MAYQATSFTPKCYSISLHLLSKSFSSVLNEMLLVQCNMRIKASSDWGGYILIQIHLNNTRNTHVILYFILF